VVSGYIIGIKTSRQQTPTYTNVADSILFL